MFSISFGSNDFISTLHYAQQIPTPTVCNTKQNYLFLMDSINESPVYAYTPYATICAI